MCVIFNEYLIPLHNHFIINEGTNPTDACTFTTTHNFVNVNLHIILIKPVIAVVMRNEHFEWQIKDSLKMYS